VKAPPAKTNETIIPAKSNAVVTKPPAIAAVRPVLSPKAQQGIRSTPATPLPAATTEVVIVQPEPAIVATPNPIHGSGSSTQPDSYTQSGVTPLTSNPGQAATPPATAPVKLLPPAPPTFPRYLYLSPPKPRAGDRKAAALAFADAQQSEQKKDLAQAMDSYRKAAALDPAWFEAQYNYAVLAFGQRDYNHSLAASEMALALQPDSADARYNFALGLKASGYAPDAVNELKKIVAANPDEARAQLALGNLYAQQMRDPAQARQHYLKWLALDPQNPQATNIRYWLTANPP
jgi:hypothetical protein